MVYVTGSLPAQVYAASLPSAHQSAQTNDNVSLTVRFSNGSIGTIVYTSSGSSAMAKEYMEVFGGGTSAVIDDFKQAVIFSKRKKRITLRHQDKGQSLMLSRFLASVRSGKPCIPFRDIYYTTLASFKAVDALGSDSPQAVYTP